MSIGDAGASSSGEAREASGGREPSLEELTAAAAHAAYRVALYRRRIYGGRGEPRRLAELERISAGAALRLRRALERRDDPHADGAPDPSLTDRGPR